MLNLIPIPKSEMAKGEWKLNLQNDVFIKLELEFSFKNKAKKLNFPSTFLALK